MKKTVLALYTISTLFTLNAFSELETYNLEASSIFVTENNHIRLQTHREDCDDQSFEQHLEECLTPYYFQSTDALEGEKLRNFLKTYTL